MVKILCRDKLKVVAIILVHIVLSICVITYMCDARLISMQPHINLDNYPVSIDYGILSDQQIETFNLILEAVNNEEMFIECTAYTSEEKHEISTQLGLYVGNTNGNLVLWSYNKIYVNLDLFKQRLSEKIIIDARVDEVVSTLREGSDRYKLWQISSYIANKIVYMEDHIDTIIALNGSGNCVTYSMLFYKMATRLGIKAYVCYGLVYGIGHAWNMVELNGEYVFYDITWYDGDSKRNHIEYLHMKSSCLEPFLVNNKWDYYDKKE